MSIIWQPESHICIDGEPLDRYDGRQIRANLKEWALTALLWFALLFFTVGLSLAAGWWLS